MRFSPGLSIVLLIRDVGIFIPILLYKAGCKRASDGSASVRPSRRADSCNWSRSALCSIKHSVTDAKSVHLDVHSLLLVIYTHAVVHVVNSYPEDRYSEIDNICIQSYIDDIYTVRLVKASHV